MKKSEKQKAHLLRLSVLNTGKKRSEEHRRRISEANRGRKFTREHKENISKSKLGKPSWNKGGTTSQETKEKQRKAKLGKKLSLKLRRKLSEIKKSSRETSNLWKGGLCDNKEYVRWLRSKRSKIKRTLKTNGSFHTFGDWENLKTQYNWTCPSCNKKEPEIKLTEDHIVPLSKGGSDNIENIQPLCKSCNSRKHTKVIKYFVKEARESGRNQ